MDEDHGQLRLIMKFTSSVDEEIEGVIKRWAPGGRQTGKIPHDSIYIKFTIRQN